ncbi:hypothetical protein MRB53_020454 [Persea americana]|uniref:Uncharacterized protein n=1 Tax=Persea americana TaxID=3435 RepID=A0ACC2L0Y4_PERAE|nr:hypothetical protein MRB53_020454 [Persea americana]
MREIEMACAGIWDGGEGEMEMGERRWEVICAWAVMEGVSWMGQRGGEGSAAVRSASIEAVRVLSTVQLLMLTVDDLKELWDQLQYNVLTVKSRLFGFFTEQTATFQKKILERSGLGQLRYLPDALRNIPPNPCMVEAGKEAEAVVFSAVDQPLAKTGVEPKGYWDFDGE